MKKTLFLLFLLPGLLACNNEDNSFRGDPNDYYRIDFYSDYEGIDYANPDLSKATLISSSYSLKTAEPAQRIASPTVEEDGIDYTVPTQTPAEGTSLSFAGWIGSYEDGSKIDTSDSEAYAVISGVKGSGVVFAYFESNPLMYSVTVKDNGKSLYSGLLPYGTDIALSPSSVQFVDGAGQNNNLPLGYTAPNYHTEGAFSHFELTLEDGEAALYEQSSYTVKEKVTIEAIYQETSKEYTVTFAKPMMVSYGEEGEESLTPIGLSSWENKRLTLAYDSSIYDEEGLVALLNEDGTKTVIVPEQLIDDGGRPFSLKGFRGQYASTDPEEVAGKGIDENHIRYDCVLTPIYQADEIAVTFVYQDGAELIREERYFPYGGTVTPPKSLPSISGENGETLVFTGKWKLNEETPLYPEQFNAYFEEHPLTEPISLTAEEYVPDTTVVDINEYKVGLDYDYAARGYDIASLTLDAFDSSNKYSVDLSDIKSPLPVTGVAGLYPKKNDGEPSPGNLYRNIVSIEFPTSVRSLKAEALYGMNSLSSLDLSYLTSLTTIEFNCFKNCFGLNELILPSSVTMIERNAFQYCDKLNQVQFKGVTQEQLNNKIAAFEEGWNDRGRDELDPVIPVIAVN